MANYPYDGTPSGITAYNPSPDDGTFRFLARTYASRHTKVSTRRHVRSVAAHACNAAAPGAGPVPTVAVISRWQRGAQQHSALPRISAYVHCPHSGSQMANSTEFVGGITNGAAWYPIYGGMQVSAALQRWWMADLQPASPVLAHAVVLQPPAHVSLNPNRR